LCLWYDWGVIRRDTALRGALVAPLFVSYNYLSLTANFL
jgi:hypothetical protein